MKLPTEALTTTYDSPLGRIRLAAHGQALCGVWFTDQADCPNEQWGVAAPQHPLLQLAAHQLAQYFAGQRQRFELPLQLATGSVFQQSVWHALLPLAWGQTCSYGAISQAIGKPSAVRAVGGAIGRNPMCIIVPCHRVLGSGGALTGYSGGVQRKRALLQLEGVL